MRASVLIGKRERSDVNVRSAERRGPHQKTARYLGYLIITHVVGSPSVSLSPSAPSHLFFSFLTFTVHTLTCDINKQTKT